MDWVKDAYEGYEKLGDFKPAELEAYRRHLLTKTKHQTDFIRKHVVDALRCPQIDVLELGSGNGRLLVDLALNGLLRRGQGVDLSASRVKFARRWAEDLKLDNIVFAESNILNMLYQRIQNPQLVVCITGTVQYFGEVNLMLRGIKQISDIALFELYKRPRDRKTWHKLDSSDRYVYILDDYTPENPTKHTKYFIKRNGSVDARVEYLHYYTIEEFLPLLQKAGFKDLLWGAQDEGTIVILAK